MWEFEIICDLNEQDILYYIQTKISKILTKNSGVMAITEKDNLLYLSMGAKYENSPEIKAHLSLILCEVICDKVKQKFMQNNLDLPEKHKNINDTFIKVCTYFDRELERQIVLRTLDLKDKKLNLQSFINFRLHNLLVKWQEFCDLANQNANMILREDNFLELLKFFTQSIESKCQSVILELKDKCLIYHDTENDFDIITAIDLKDNFQVLSKIVELNPYLIKIHSNGENFDIINMLRSVFEDRVELG